MSFTINGKHLSLPALIPSISSFETQIIPESALDLQAAIAEPITLVSAYDLHQTPALIEKVSQFRNGGRIVFMDSGGYEYSRINRYVQDENLWDFNSFKACVEKCEVDLVASFDYFMSLDQSFVQFQDNFLSHIQEHNFIAQESLIPVIHLQTYRNEYAFSLIEILDICERISIEFEPNFIAIPERELGDGIGEKIDKVRAITERLRKNGRETKLHILGCGNPLSFALLCNAGAAMADGLEWCRTLVGSDFKLHHFQHDELFEEPKNNIYNPTVDIIRNNSSVYKLRVLARNLHALQQFNSEIASMLSLGHLSGFIEDNFGIKAAEFVRR